MADPRRNPHIPQQAEPDVVSTSPASLRPSYPHEAPRLQAAFAQGPKRNSFQSSLSVDGSPYPAYQPSISSVSAHSISEKFALSPDLSLWGADISPSRLEADDALHNPDPRRDKQSDRGGTIFTVRGLVNLGCLAVLVLGFVALFAGYPMITYFTKRPVTLHGAFNLGGMNASGQVPSFPGSPGLIDVDTPQSAYTRLSTRDSSKTLELVFSDEFNTEARSFYPGDDPYWEAVDLNYWQTGNLEWYDPAAITTRNGSLEITLSLKQTHGLNYQGGMMSTWNKFCFTGGLIETSVSLPGANNVIGLWPAVWTMGNLGRAGFGASLEGMWPYSYDSCDVGTLANQTKDGLPLAALEVGDPSNGNVLSYLPGQRLSRCTCPGESHPGPFHEDGTYVGRSAPEIDIIEATVEGDPLHGRVSQSCQFAPFNFNYTYPTEGNTVLYDTGISDLNPYKGGAFQQSVSALSDTDSFAYQENGGGFAVYGFEYKGGFDDAYITWINNDKPAWTLLSSAMTADSQVEIGPRAIPQEPMYIIANLGISPQFGMPDFANLIFPAVMRIDYIRVYQDPAEKNIGCDPEDFPTAAYIDQYPEAYTNPNLTTWRDDFKQPFPKSLLLDECTA